MARDCTLNCACGATEWYIKDKRTGRHIMCYCADCQTFARHLGQDNRHLKNGGTQIFQTIPANVEFTKGAENLSLMRLSPKGTFRWYLKCCNTPFANTLPKRAIPFAGMILPAGHDAFGRVRSHVNTEAAHISVKQTGLGATVWAFISRAIASRLSGTGNVTPFFDDAGEPAAEARILTKQERATARP